MYATRSTTLHGPGVRALSAPSRAWSAFRSIGAVNARLTTHPEQPVPNGGRTMEYEDALASVVDILRQRAVAKLGPITYGDLSGRAGSLRSPYVPACEGPMPYLLHASRVHTCRQESA